MASSSALILLPPRHTAQSAQDSKKTSKPSSDGSFAPKLDKAWKQKQAAAQTAVATVKAPVARVVVSKPAVSESDEAEKDSTSISGQQKKQAVPPEEIDQSETADEAKQPAASTPAATALAQAAVSAEKKTVKPSKVVPGKSSAIRKSVANTAASTPRTPTDPANADGDDDDSADPASDQTVAIGGGFYGSGKVVARAATDSADDAASPAAADAQADADSAAAAVDQPPAVSEAEIATEPQSGTSTPAPVAHPDTATVLNALTVPGAEPSAITGRAAVATSPQASFVEANHPTIISGISGQLLPKGGTMQLRLDPPELGALQVTVHLKDGVMTASFQTSNDDATKLLSRSLGQLKSGLEAAGMSVEKLHVEQAPKENSKQDSEGNSKQPAQQQQNQAQQDQQRRELVQRMWRKLAGGGDPLDLVA